MQKRCITIPGSAAPVAPYTPAVAAGNLLFVSGQVSNDPITGEQLHGTFEQEARQVLNNLKRMLEGSGSGLEHVVKATVFLKDMGKFNELNAIYKEYFPENPPARTCIQAGKLPADFQVEIEAIAIIPG